MVERYDNDVEEDENKGRPDVAISAAVGEEDEGNKPGGDLEDVAGEKQEPSKCIHAKVQGAVLFERLVEGERPGEAEAGGEDRPELKLSHAGEKL